MSSHEVNIIKYLQADPNHRARRKYSKVIFCYLDGEFMTKSRDEHVWRRSILPFNSIKDLVIVPPSKPKTETRWLWANKVDGRLTASYNTCMSSNWIKLKWSATKFEVT